MPFHYVSPPKTAAVNDNNENLEILQTRHAIVENKPVMSKHYQKIDQKKQKTKKQKNWGRQPTKHREKR